jgi:hypothetical protein
MSGRSSRNGPELRVYGRIETATPAELTKSSAAGLRWLPAAGFSTQKLCA